jgi:hypothetical protein
VGSVVSGRFRWALMGCGGFLCVLVGSEVLWVLTSFWWVLTASGGFGLWWALMGFGGLVDSGEFLWVLVGSGWFWLAPAASVLVDSGGFCWPRGRLWWFWWALVGSGGF